MTRGRCGPLCLHRMTLSFTTPRRFSSALSGHPISLLSSKKFVHNNFSRLAISALFTAHLSSRLLPRSFHWSASLPRKANPHLSVISIRCASSASKHPLSKLHDSGERPCIVPHEVICLYVGTRALSPNSNLLSSSGYAARIEFLLLLHQGPCNDKYLCRKLHPHFGTDPLLPLPAFELFRKVGHELSVPC